jgi:hypothetical protein
MGSGGVIYVPSFIKIGLGIQKLIREGTQTYRQQGDLISLLLLFRNKESTLIMTNGKIIQQVNTFRCFGHSLYYGENNKEVKTSNFCRIDI